MPTDEEFLLFRRAVIKKLKFLEGLIDDSFQKISDLDNRLTENVDEAIDRAARAERAVRRVKKAFEAHVEDDEE